MKKTFIFLLMLLFSGALMAQPIFNLGLKAGLNNSKVTFRTSEFNSESVTKAHFGAFGRIGWGMLYIQPEAYYIAKGGRVIDPNASAAERVTRFDFNNIDVPLLFGVRILDGQMANLRAMAGPVFSFMTSQKIEPEDLLDTQFYKSNYIGYQYGLGVDFRNLFLDARMEHGATKLYEQPLRGIDGRNQTFMITVGFKIL
jgi:hypothetical protein